MNRTCHISLLLIFFFPLLLVAEDSRGRLADGRAYRTDAAGNQIIDYVAELELEIDALKRRVHGLEYELEEKQKVIARSGSASGGTLQEKDLISGRKKVVTKDPPKPRFVADEFKDDSTDCDSEITSIRTQLTQSQNQNSRLKNQLQTLEQKLGSQHGASKELAAFKASKESELQRREEQYKGKLGAISEENNSLKEQIARLELDLENKQQVIDDKESEIQALDKELQEVTVRAQTKQPPPPPPYAPKRVTQRTPTRVAAFDSLRAGVTKYLQRLKRLVTERDKLFASYKRRGGNSLSLSPKKAISSRGRSVSKIEMLLARAKKTVELTQLQRDVREISTNMKTDIAFIKRMRQLS